MYEAINETFVEWNYCNSSTTCSMNDRHKSVKRQSASEAMLRTKIIIVMLIKELAST